MYPRPDMPQLAEHFSPAVPSLPLSPADWEQIEDSREVEAVLADLQGRSRRQVFECAEIYDLAYPGYEGDREFYLEQGRNGRVLYLGAGTGRIFSPLAAQNQQAIGVELSPAMVERLRAKNSHLQNGRLIQEDATRVELPRHHFDTVLAPYSFLQVIPPERLSSLLEHVWDSLKPGGKFCTDTFSPYLIPFRKLGLETSIREIGADTRIAIYVLYDHLRQSMTELARVTTPERDDVFEMNLHYYFPQEIVDALQAAGLENVQVKGGYHDEPFDPTANEVLVYEAQAPRGRNGRAARH